MKNLTKVLVVISSIAGLFFYGCKHHPDPLPADNCIVPIEITIDSTTTTSCGDTNGSVYFTASGGSGSGFQFSLDGEIFQSTNSFHNLVAGTYTLTTKDSLQCITTDTFTINNITDMTVVTSFEPSNCSVSDGIINISASGGVKPYLFSIDNGISFRNDSVFKNLSSGIYTIVVKDSTGCVKAQDMTLTNIAGTLSFSITVSIANCGANDGSIIVNASGGAGGYLYSLNNGTFLANSTFNNLNYGTFTVAVMDNDNCIISQSVVINVVSPSYTNDIAPILASTCSTTSCHGTPTSNKPALNSWSAVNSNKTLIKSDLNSGKMPIPANAISATDKALIICWIDAGALNN